ncbi:glucose 1-dehydrogenase [Leucobacter sp. gxy201]|uniref:SDR family NAD(P)-dependent oxidoreductase n=1 Tax=Leucobacter sp. gxy201 TaxID=2957200 RepID=UPI003DA1C82B
MGNLNWDFTSRRVLVTGAASGIGYGVASLFARSGARVAVLDRPGDALDAAVASLSEAAQEAVIAIPADLSSLDEIERAAGEVEQRLGGLDTLVNNAGVGKEIALVDTDDAHLDFVLDVNLRAVIALTRELVPALIRSGDGASVINLASQAAKVGNPGITVYSASKAGVIGFTRSLAAELAPQGVRVNSVAPGTVLTPMMENNIRHTSEERGISYEEAYGVWAAPIPLGRMQGPQNIAAAIAFLASDLASEITGESLNVSGGLVTV